MKRGDEERAAEEAHQRFLDRYYGWSRHVYDATRRYYLLGRDRAIEQLASEPWERLVEVGPGTGRNLRALHRLRPSAKLGGVEASTAMLAHARPRCGFATLVSGFAERADLASVLDGRPDRIFFSYTLSMIAEPQKALENAERALAPGGSIVLVDFGDLRGVPRPMQRAFSSWLETFHVRTGGLLAQLPRADRYEVGALGLYELARLERRTSAHDERPV